MYPPHEWEFLVRLRICDYQIVGVRVESGGRDKEVYQGQGKVNRVNGIGVLNKAEIPFDRDWDVLVESGGGESVFGVEPFENVVEEIVEFD